jgi:hypothetical protein
MWPAKGDIVEGSYRDVCPERYLSGGRAESGGGGYGHEHDKMTFIMEADTLVYPCEG